MPRLTYEQLCDLAARFEAELGSAGSPNHPAWIQKRLDALRTLIRQKERALDHRAGRRRPGGEPEAA